MGRLGFPKNRLVKVKYSHLLDLDVKNSLSNKYDSGSFRATSAYDPLTGAGGHQPYGWDQWSLFYSRYCVLSATCVCRISRNETSADANQYMIGIDVSNGSAYDEPDNWADARERSAGRGTAFKTITGVIGDGPARKVVARYNAKQWHNVKDVQDNADLWGYCETSNPVINTYFLPFIYSSYAVLAAEAKFQVTVDIYYTVLLADPNMLAQST